MRKAVRTKVCQTLFQKLSERLFNFATSRGDLFYFSTFDVYTAVKEEIFHGDKGSDRKHAGTGIRTLDLLTCIIYFAADAPSKGSLPFLSGLKPPPGSNPI